MDAVLQRAVRSQGALHDSPPRRMALLLWSIAKLAPTPLPPSSLAPAAAMVDAGALSVSASASAVDAILAMTLAPTRVRPYLRMSSPPVLAQV